MYDENYNPEIGFIGPCVECTDDVFEQENPRSFRDGGLLCQDCAKEYDEDCLHPANKPEIPVDIT